MLKIKIKIKALTIFILIASISFSLISCDGGGNASSDSTSGYTVYSDQFMDTFDTVVTVIAHSKTRGEFDEIFEYAETRFIELHKYYDIYHTYDGINNAKTINDNAGIAPVVISNDLMNVLLLSKEWYSRTDGETNVMMGSVLKIWHDYRDSADPESTENPLPNYEELAAANEYSSIDNLVLDEAAMTAYISIPQASLDIGAVAKGYATEIVCDELADMGYKSFAISAGGNVKTVGKPLAKDRDTWVIGIANPQLDATPTDSSDDLIDKVLVADESVVTSGWYQRYFMSGGKAYHHIIDPDTLFPNDTFKSVTIVYPDSAVCDILSTALINLTYEDGLALIDSLQGASAYWVLADGSIKTSAGMDLLLESKQ